MRTSKETDSINGKFAIDAGSLGCYKEFSDQCTYVWIKPAGFKLKEMDVSNIHIVLSDNSVKRLKDVISQAKVTEQYIDDCFFYLYTTEKFQPDKNAIGQFSQSKDKEDAVNEDFKVVMWY
ncbi:MAG: hypothetical protein K2O45_03255 [Oscillospiraceae bacterium]|nr:hypothetical protein [Oscillospiraceae bacterium]